MDIKEAFEHVVEKIAEVFERKEDKEAKPTEDMGLFKATGEALTIISNPAAAGEAAANGENPADVAPDPSSPGADLVGDALGDVAIEKPSTETESSATLGVTGDAAQTITP